jgi:serine/threonine protein kinase
MDMPDEPLDKKEAELPTASMPAQPAVEVAASQPPAVIPRSIGGYRITRIIGSGGMGTVYLAEQEHPNRTVALKVINPGVASQHLLRRFDHEADILGKLQHPGIAQVYEAGTFDAGSGAQPYFAMELIEGSPLTDYARHHKLSTRQCLELMVRICDAVQHAHQRGVIHRDLKPGNILVDQTGQSKILDFGVARATDADIQATTLQTEIGQLLGTVPPTSWTHAATSTPWASSPTSCCAAACPTSSRAR